MSFVVSKLNTAVASSSDITYRRPVPSLREQEPVGGVGENVLKNTLPAAVMGEARLFSPESVSSTRQPLLRFGVTVQLESCRQLLVRSSR